ncbi:MAG: hypothetical protein EZS28_001788 [Streblomastix strix]|uniref:Uncharacterized protein n=1 Tax=Streblomastix strix TaxID=222440 RepID=A0A5J4X617_9EUKA|nr:MAG: hypothetical protein EZS28_001788 [Streblomastix strix]
MMSSSTCAHPVIYCNLCAICGVDLEEESENIVKFGDIDGDQANKKDSSINHEPHVIIPDTFSDNQAKSLSTLPLQEVKITIPPKDLEQELSNVFESLNTLQSPNKRSRPELKREEKYRQHGNKKKTSSQTNQVFEDQTQQDQIIYENEYEKKDDEDNEVNDWDECGPFLGKLYQMGYDGYIGFKDWNGKNERNEDEEDTSDSDDITDQEQEQDKQNKRKVKSIKSQCKDGQDSYTQLLKQGMKEQEEQEQEEISNGMKIRSKSNSTKKGRKKKSKKRPRKEE